MLCPRFFPNTRHYLFERTSATLYTAYANLPKWCLRRVDGGVTNRGELLLHATSRTMVGRVERGAADRGATRAQSRGCRSSKWSVAMIAGQPHLGCARSLWGGVVKG